MIISELPYAESSGTPPPLLPSYSQTFGNARNHQRCRTVGTIVLHLPVLQLVMQRKKQAFLKCSSTLAATCLRYTSSRSRCQSPHHPDPTRSRQPGNPRRAIYRSLMCRSVPRPSSGFVGPRSSFRPAVSTSRLGSRRISACTLLLRASRFVLPHLRPSLSWLTSPLTTNAFQYPVE